MRTSVARTAIFLAMNACLMGGAIAETITDTVAGAVAGTVTETQSMLRAADASIASIHSDISFTLLTGPRVAAACSDAEDCTNRPDKVAEMLFSAQVRRIAELLQEGAETAFSERTQRIPGSANGKFDVFVVDGYAFDATSSASGKIAISSTIGSVLPVDEVVAFIIAREMGHVLAGHHENNAAASIVTSILMNVLIPGSGLVKSAVSMGSSLIAASSNRDAQAREADRVAIHLLDAAGYDLQDIAANMGRGGLALDESGWSQRFKVSTAYLAAENQRRLTPVAPDTMPTPPVMVAAQPQPAAQPTSPQPQPLIRWFVFGFALDAVQLADELQRRLCQRALVGLVQIEELAPGVCHTAHFHHRAAGKGGLVAAEVIANQASAPVPQEAARMFA